MLALLCTATALTLKTETATPLRLRGGGLKLETSTMNLAGALYHAGFGISLYTMPDSFTPSGMAPVKYTEDIEGPVGKFAHSGFGAMMLAMGSGALLDTDNEGFTKMFAIAMTLFCPILAKNTMPDAPGMKVKMWRAQALMHVPFTALMVWKAFFKKD